MEDSSKYTHTKTQVWHSGAGEKPKPSHADCVVLAITHHQKRLSLVEHHQSLSLWSRVRVVELLLVGARKNINLVF